MPDHQRSPSTPALEPETWALRDLQTVVADLDAALSRRMQMHTRDLAAMEHLSFAEQPMGPGELGTRLGLSPAATTELVDRLERAGHLERRRDTEDRRRIRLHTSDRATGEVLGALASLLEDLDGIAAAMTPNERAAVQHYLAKVIEAYRRWAADS